MAARRLSKEAKSIVQNKCLSHIIKYARPIDAERPMLIWEACIFGPRGTPYEDGSYRLSITFPDNYPYDPPKIRFMTRIYHAHITTENDIELNIMKNHWSPHFKLTTILCSIVECMSIGHNQDNPMVPSIAVKCVKICNNSCVPQFNGITCMQWESV